MWLLVMRRALDDLVAMTTAQTMTTQKRHWYLPSRRNPFLLGRQPVIQTLFEGFQHTSQSPALALSGPGGIGKTQIAIEYAYQCAGRYQAILFANASSQEELITSYFRLADALGLLERESQDQQYMVRAVKDWLQQQDQWFLILDNADDPSLLPAFLPVTFRGHLFLTTRAVALGGLASRLDIAPLSPEDAALFLLRRSTLIAPQASLDDVAPQDRDIALRIAEHLDCFPLALDQAGAYVEETATSLATYVSLLQHLPFPLLQERRGLGIDHPDSIVATWQLACTRIEQRHPAAADLLRLCAFLAPDHIPDELFLKGSPVLGKPLGKVTANPFLLNQAIETIRSCSFCFRHAGESAIHIHRFVQLVLRESMTGRQRKQWLRRAIRAIILAFPEATALQAMQCESYLPHILTCVQLFHKEGGNMIEMARLLNRAGSYLKGRLRSSEAEDLLVQAVERNERLIGPTSSETATSLNNLAVLSLHQARYDQAQALFLRSIAIIEQQTDPDKVLLATNWNDLAGWCVLKGQYTEAETIFKQALALRQTHLGNQHLETATTLNNLASLSVSEQRYSEAEPLHQQALEAYEAHFGSSHPSTADTINNLAFLAERQGRYSEAEPLFQRALALREQLLGPDHPNVANSLHHLAGVYEKQGRFAEAEPLHRRASQIRRAYWGPDHPYTATSQYDFAGWYSRQGRYAEAESLSLEALNINEKHLGPDTLVVALDLYDLAMVYIHQERYAEAETLLQRALTLREKQLGPDHAETRETAHQLQSVREKQSLG